MFITIKNGQLGCWFLPIHTNTWCIQSNLYYEGTYGTKEMWPNKKDDYLKEVHFIWNFPWPDKKNETFEYR